MFIRGCSIKEAQLITDAAAPTAWLRIIIVIGAIIWRKFSWRKLPTPAIPNPINNRRFAMMPITLEAYRYRARQLGHLLHLLRY